MADNLRKRARVEQTIGEFDRLKNEFDHWYQRRVDADENHQYQTQLFALHKVVHQVIADQLSDTEALATANLSINTMYARCFIQENKLLWVRGVLWGYYRDKFDQRDDKDTGTVLLAADDIVWSCYREAVKNAGQPTTLPLPLAYLAPEISPRALPRELLRLELGSSPYGDPSQLPIPLVKLPPICTSAPWWLVYLGHEVGHQVLHDLKLMADFKRKIQLAAGVSPQALDQGTADSEWGKWSEEIFADVFSVYMMGAEAAWAVGELILDEDLLMLSSRTPNYPPPVVRLALLSRIVDALELRDQAMQDEVDTDRLLNLPLDNEIQRGIQTKARQAVDLLPQIVPALTEYQKEPASLLRKLCGWPTQEKGDFPSKNTIRDWHHAFVSAKKPLFGPSLSMARLITSAAAQRWREIISSDQISDRQAAQVDLKEQFLEAIRTHRDPATRASKKEALPDLTAIASGISQALRQARFDEV